MLIHLNKKDSQILKELADIWLGINLEVHDFVSEAYWKSNYDDVLIAFQDAELLIYKQHDEIVGFCGIVDNYIAGIFIKKGSRHQGIGQQFIDYLKHKHKQLTLKVYTQNTKALHFYQALDFRIIDEQVDEMNHHEYLMAWEEE